MALGTLGDLRAAVCATRADMVERFLDILALAEQRMYYGGDGVSPLRIRAMEATADLEFTSGMASLPATFLDKRAIIWPGMQAVSVSYEPPGTFYANEASRTGGSYPEAYTIEGDTIKVSPAVTGTAKLLHYAKADALALDNDTNVILQAFPGVYLYGCQVELSRMTRDATQEQLSLKRYADAVHAANTHTMLSRTFGGPLRKAVGFAI